MMRYVIGFVLGLLLSTQAHAMTQAFFKDGQASILLAGMPGDPDAPGLYNALTIPPEDFQGKWSKKFAVTTPDGKIQALSIVCVFSKQLLNNGSCTVIFKAAPGMVDIDAGAGRARLALSGDAAAKLASVFHLSATDPLVYRSKDGRLTAAVATSEGRVENFVFDWNGKGL